MDLVQLASRWGCEMGLTRDSKIDLFLERVRADL